MILVSVLASFWKPFGVHLVSSFGILFCIDIWMAFFRIFLSFWVTWADFFALLDQKGSPRGLQKHLACSPFWHPGAAPRPKASKTSPKALKISSVALKTGPRATCKGSFFNGCWLNVERILDSFWMHLVWIWNRYFMILERIYTFERIPVECFRAYSHIDITSPSIKYYDGVGGMRR